MGINQSTLDQSRRSPIGATTGSNSSCSSTINSRQYHCRSSASSRTTTICNGDNNNNNSSENSQRYYEDHSNTTAESSSTRSCSSRSNRSSSRTSSNNGSPVYSAAEAEAEAEWKNSQEQAMPCCKDFEGCVELKHHRKNDTANNDSFQSISTFTTSIPSLPSLQASTQQSQMYSSSLPQQHYATRSPSSSINHGSYGLSSSIRIPMNDASSVSCTSSSSMAIAYPTAELRRVSTSSTTTTFPDSTSQYYNNSRVIPPFRRKDYNDVSTMPNTQAVEELLDCSDRTLTIEDNYDEYTTSDEKTYNHHHHNMMNMTSETTNGNTTSTTATTATTTTTTTAPNNYQHLKRMYDKRTWSMYVRLRDARERTHSSSNSSSSHRNKNNNNSDHCNSFNNTNSHDFTSEDHTSNEIITGTAANVHQNENQHVMIFGGME